MVVWSVKERTREKGQEQRDRLYTKAELDIPHAIVPKKGTLEELRVQIWRYG